MCLDKIVIISVWNKLWDQHLDICERDRYQLSQGARGVGFLVGPLSAKKHKVMESVFSDLNPYALSRQGISESFQRGLL